MSGARGGRTSSQGLRSFKCTLCQATCVSRHSHRLPKAVYPLVLRLWPNAVVRLRKPLESYTELKVCCKWLKDTHPNRITNYADYLRHSAPLLDGPVVTDAARSDRAFRAAARGARAQDEAQSVETPPKVSKKRKRKFWCANISDVAAYAPVQGTRAATA